MLLPQHLLNVQHNDPSQGQTAMSRKAGSTRPRLSDQSNEGARGQLCLPRERILAMDCAREGFSATMNTVFILAWDLQAPRPCPSQLQDNSEGNVMTARSSGPPSRPRPTP